MPLRRLHNAVEKRAAGVLQGLIQPGNAPAFLYLTECDRFTVVLYAVGNFPVLFCVRAVLIKPPAGRVVRTNVKGGVKNAKRVFNTPVIGCKRRLRADRTGGGFPYIRMLPPEGPEPLSHVNLPAYLERT